MMLAVLLLLVLGSILPACSSTPDDDTVGFTATLSCRADPNCPPDDRKLAAAYEAQCYEETTVEGKRVLIDHCIKSLSRYAGVGGGTGDFILMRDEELTAAERRALFIAEDRNFRRP
jgi:hypothetical protein